MSIHYGVVILVLLTTVSKCSASDPQSFDNDTLSHFRDIIQNKDLAVTTTYSEHGIPIRVLFIPGHLRVMHERDKTKLFILFAEVLDVGDKHDAEQAIGYYIGFKLGSDNWHIVDSIINADIDAKRDGQPSAREEWSVNIRSEIYRLSRPKSSNAMPEVKKD